MIYILYILMIGYKGFDKNLCCKGMQYLLNHAHEHLGNVAMCVSGFHFCTVPVKVLQHYPNVDGNKYAIIEASGIIKHSQDKSVTNTLIIKKIITYEELIERCTGKFINNGTEEWYLNGLLHRDGDQPAIITQSGDREWYVNGKRHGNNDRPAVINDMETIWCKYGKVHRDNDMPAIVCTNGTKMWYNNGRLHRDGDKPASIHPNKSAIWYKNGKIHRDGDQPAIICIDGTEIWFNNGTSYKTEKVKVI